MKAGSPASVAGPAPAHNAPIPDSFDSLKAIAAQIESYLKSTGRTLDFSVDPPTGRAVITVRDAQSGEVIRQIPSEEALRLAQALGNTSSALVDLIA